MFGTHRHGVDTPNPWKVPTNTEAREVVIRRPSRGAFLLGVLSSAALVATFLAIGSSASASSGNLKTFGTGTVTITGANSATIVNLAGQYGGVYQQSKTYSGLALSDVHLSFVSTGDETGGAPRFSIPINTSGPSGGAGSVAGYAFMDALGCGGTTDTTVTVSTSNTACGVNFQSVEYTNWATFAATFPSYRTAQGHFPFIIADEPGNYAVNSIVLT